MVKRLTEADSILAGTSEVARDIESIRLARLYEFIMGSNSLDLADALFGVGDYVSLDAVLREEIQNVCTDIRAYVNLRGARRPLNICVLAPPGSGKSFVVKSIRTAVAAATGKSNVYYPFYEINLTALYEREDIYSYLANVVNRHHEDYIPFVLFDEIDAPSSGDAFFKNMLMPMWDGAVVSDSKSCELKACVFFFAGTPDGLNRVVTGAPWPDQCRRSRNSVYEKMIRYVAGFGHNAHRGHQNCRSVSSDVAVESRREWRSAQSALLDTLAAQGAESKFRDFYDRLDRRLFIPQSNLYFEDLDTTDAATPYFGDLELLDFFLIKILRGNEAVTAIEKRALSTLCSRIYPSRRAMEKAVFLSSFEEVEAVYRYEHLPSTTRARCAPLINTDNIDEHGTLTVKGIGTGNTY